jgi:hypothetical protein
MRGWLLLLALMLATPVAQAQICRIDDGNGGVVEYPCGSGENAPADGSAGDEPWWASSTAQAILAFVGLLGSAGAAGFAYVRMRRRSGRLTTTLVAIETTYAQAKGQPETGITRLADLRRDIRLQHEKGKLDDAHFLDLDKRASDYLVRLRLLEIDRQFATLPPMVLAELRRLPSDGALSQTEADLIEVRASVYHVPDASRTQLANLARRWAQDDGPRRDAIPA